MKIVRREICKYVRGEITVRKQLHNVSIGLIDPEYESMITLDGCMAHDARVWCPIKEIHLHPNYNDEIVEYEDGSREILSPKNSTLSSLIEGELL